MASSQKTIDQVSKLVSSMPVSLRASLALVAVMVLGAFLWLSMRNSSSGYTPLSFGKAFTTEEIIHAEQAFQDAGLNDFRREGQIFHVPKADLTRYHAALLNSGALPAGFGDALEKQLEKGMGVFESSRTAQERKDIALAKFLQQTIEAIPNIEFASVAWARSKASRWPHQETSVTATVNVRPKRGVELSPIQIRSFRTAVAAMVPDLTPANVTVFDMSTGISHVPDDIDGAIDNGLMNRIHEFTRDYEAKISKALSYIPDVLVTVHVDVEELKSRVERIQKIDAKGAFKVYESNQSRTEEVANQYPRSEPGVRNNQPRSLQTATGPTESRQLNHEDNTSTSAPSFTLTEQEFFAAMPKAVQVSVKIPQSYYEAVAQESGLAAPPSGETDDSFQRAVLEIEQKEIETVKATTAVLIPKGSDPSSINVSSYHSVQGAEPASEPGLWQQLVEAGSNWGGKLGLLALACWGLWMVGRSLPAYPAEMERAIETERAAIEKEKTVEPPEPVIRKVTSTRDALQNVVRDNPDVTAGILEEWLDQVKA
jgi:flagellar biosynthesis/type III secretory pathway M-ring protein FliF/YscJ